MKRSRRCPCGSRRLYSNCCMRFLETGPCVGMNPEDTFLKGWTEKYGRANAHTFARRTRTYVFRISCLLQSFLDRYMQSPIVQTSGGLKAVDEPMHCIEHATLLSIFGSLVLLQEGLFMQSGTLLRSVLENCFVLIDACENDGQMELLAQDKYSVRKVVNRTKQYLPDCMREWYGYFSRNFTHFGPLHQAPFIPTKCWGDNWVLVTGLQNVVRGCVAFGIVLERLHYDRSLPPIFWKHTSNSALIFDEDAPVWSWVDELRREIVASHPPGERKADFSYSEKAYRLKCERPLQDET